MLKQQPTKKQKRRRLKKLIWDIEEVVRKKIKVEEYKFELNGHEFLIRNRDYNFQKAVVECRTRKGNWLIGISTVIELFCQQGKEEDLILCFEEILLVNV
jgi:hypothetical protein